MKKLESKYQRQITVDSINDASIDTLSHDKCLNLYHRTMIGETLQSDLKSYLDFEFKTRRIRKLEGCMMAISQNGKLHLLGKEIPTRSTIDDLCDTLERSLIHHDRQLNIDVFSKDEYPLNIDFIFDSGCTKHMCGEIELFDELTEEKGLVVRSDFLIMSYMYHN